MENEANFAVQWHLIDACNLNCRHCYGNDLHSELYFSDLTKIISDISSTISIWNSFTPLSKSINYTGGEPLLYKNLFKLIDYSNKEGFSSAILTNGTLVDKDKARIISNLGVSYVQISVDDINDHHDSLRGLKDAFKMALQGIENLVEEGVFVNVSCTLSKLNVGRIEEIISLMATVGVSSIRFPRLVPIGRGRQLNQNMLSSDETKNAFIHLAKLSVEYNSKIEVMLDDPLFALLNLPQTCESTCSTESNIFCEGACSIGFTGICIMPDGTLYPCRKMPIPLGNIIKTSFRDIWVNSDVLNNIRNINNLKGHCGNCSLSYKCKGCRAMAYAVSGDYLGHDIQCWKERGL